MLKRKVEKQLSSWKNNKDRKPLIVKGLRQCGKTFSVKKFAEENYKSIIYINFQKNDQFNKIFEHSLEVDDIKILMSTYLRDIEFIDYDTVIILDEIQECPRARTAKVF